jgi:hypothetical protein
MQVYTGGIARETLNQPRDLRFLPPRRESVLFGGTV